MIYFAITSLNIIQLIYKYNLFNENTLSKKYKLNTIITFSKLDFFRSISLLIFYIWTSVINCLLDIVARDTKKKLFVYM